MTLELKSIAELFDVRGNVVDVYPMGSGNINDTFLVRTETGCPDYVLQRINNAVFKDVELLQTNIEAVTVHIRLKLESAGVPDIDRKVLTLIPLKGAANTWTCVDGKYWRMTLLIADATTPDEVTPESSYDAGLAFGRFESMLTDLPQQLGESIPDFHNMELRSRQLREAVETDAAGRMSDPEVRELVAFLQSNDEEMCKAERLYREGLLPKRICHCDTKVNNMLFDKDGRFLCVIDLDTMMPGFVFSDFGDFMRTAASSLIEDDPDFEHVEFRMDIFKSFAKGYLESAGCFLTDIERDNLPYAALRFAHMQAVRFLADYINGDTYYKIAYPTHNLVRTRNQVALYKSIDLHYTEMCEYIASLPR